MALLQVIRLRAKLTDAAASVKGLFGVKSEKDTAVQKMEALKVRPHRCVINLLREIAPMTPQLMTGGAACPGSHK